jgi:hypothetical protein
MPSWWFGIKKGRDLDKWLFYVFSLGLCLVGFLLSYVPWHLGKVAGDALIIAGLLAMTVDRFLKARFLREMSTDVAKYLIGYSLPRELQDRIQELMGTRLIGCDAEFRYRLRETHEHYVEMETELSWVLENFSNSPEEYQQRVTTERRYNARVVELRCDCDDSQLAYRLQDQNLLMPSEDHPNILSATGPLRRIPAHTHDRGIRPRFAARFIANPPSNFSDSPERLELPLNRLTIIVDAPPNFDVSVMPPPDAKFPGRWEYHRLLLPNEAIWIRWHRIGD